MTNEDKTELGGNLFEAEVLLDLPEDVSVDELRRSLEAVADELMVDVDLTD